MLLAKESRHVSEANLPKDCGVECEDSNVRWIHEAAAMGCSASAAAKMQPQFEKSVKAAVLIQQWYRGHAARTEMKQRYTWNIFQTMEYAGEQDQLQLSQFFAFLMDYYIHRTAQWEMTDDMFPEILNLCDSVKFDRMPEIAKVPSYYRGPRISFPLQVSDVGTLLKAFKQRRQLHSWYVLNLLLETKNILKKMPNINHLSTRYSKDITVCDLHGKLDDLLLIFHKNGHPMPKKSYVFNGDFVDRGENSVEVIIILFAFFLIYPKDVHLNRGNHEDCVMNIRYGFKKEVLSKYKSQGLKILQLFQDVFRWLPLATIIDSKVLVVHGGISDTTDLDFLASVERQRFKSLLRVHKGIPKECLIQGSSTRPGSELSLDVAGHNNAMPGSGPSSSSPSVSPLTESHRDQQRFNASGIFPSYSKDLLDLPFLDEEIEFSDETIREELEWKQIADILWSDPRKGDGCFPNTRRGGGCYFGEDVTEKMLRKYKLKLLIRSHECKQDGYEVCHNGKVITIFSASNYYAMGSNLGAYIKIGPDLVPHFVKYRVSKSTRKLTLQQRVSVVEETALKDLREKLFTHQAEIITAFRYFDPDRTGEISSSEWASAMHSALHLNVPWRTLRPRLAKNFANGKVDYLSTFKDLKFEQPLKEVQTHLNEAMCRHRANLEIIFGMISKSRTGLISMEEFQQTWKLFSSHMNVHVDNSYVDDLARSIDFNNDGFIEFNEFLEAFRLVQKDND
ncbi:serine/threonine-protein phosphatase with EF-hands 1 isoform X2 [Rhinoraja longicauda]